MPAQDEPRPTAWEVDLYVEAWDEKREELAAIFTDLMKRVPAARPLLV